MPYSICIGLEIHLSVKTNYKMFSPDNKDSYSWKSCGFLGTLPSLNYEAVKGTIKLSYALNSEVNYKNIRFDRKNYFYYDLPRGYQITQYFHPIGKNGYIDLKNGKKIRIKQVHLEEDTAQQSKQGHVIRLFFSRLGQAIIEVVTEPDFSSYEEVDDFLKRLRWICLLLNVSDASYSKGEMRVDLNISLKNDDLKVFSKKSEVKNLNSSEAIKKSIIYLSNKKQQLLNKGQDLESYTYAWVEKLEKCEVMRKKENFKRYFYIPEANIPKLVISEEEYQEIISDAKINLSEIIDVLENAKLEEKEISHLLNNTRLLNEVFILSKKLKNLHSAYTWIVNIVWGMAKKSKNKDYSYQEIEEAIINFEMKKINQSQAKKIIKEIILQGITYKKALKITKAEKESDDSEVLKIITEIFDKNQHQLPKLLENIHKLERFIIGECMKQTAGQADPKKAKKYFDQVLSKYIKN